jgi:hypothetical protein
LGVAVPEWIRRHATPGYIRAVYNGAAPSVTIENQIIYAADYSELRIVEAAMENRVRSMRIQAEKIMEYELSRAQRAA